MAAPSPQDVTQLLEAWSNGEQEALEQLIPLVYNELHRLAHRYMERERQGHTLQSTALVHEAYERLINLKDVSWQNRAHFFAVSAQLMRRILVDYARSRRYSKRGGEWRQVPLNEAVAVFRDRRTDIVELDDALANSGRYRSKERPRGRDAFFWWPEYQGNGRGSQRFSGNRPARLEAGESLASAAAQPEGG